MPELPAGAASITPLDYAVLGFYLVAMLVIGGFFAKQQRTSKDFFLAGRSMGWVPVGLSLAAAHFTARSFAADPGEAYQVGFRVLLPIVCIFATIPLMWWLVMPLYRRLEVVSIYEYLEQRFSLVVRLASSVLFVGWRLMWMGGVIYAPCKVLTLATGSDGALVPLLLVVGATTTAYTFLGGMKGVIWTDVVQAFLMIGGAFCLIGGVNYYLEGGIADVWKRAEELGRIELAKFSPRRGEAFWSDRWLTWGLAPHYFFSLLTFYIADQITVQRFLTTKSLQASRQSFLLNVGTLIVLSVSLAYAGVSLLVFYNARPEAMRPSWVAIAAKDEQGNIHERSPGVPYLNPRTDVAANLEELIAARAIAAPNTQEPFTSASQVLDPETGKLLIERLAERDPRTGEYRVQRGEEELMPHFLVHFIPPGVVGLILAALVAASMSSLDSGLNSIATLIVSDYYRRVGFGKQLVARLRGKPAAELDERDELWLGRWLVLVIGVAATLFALWVSRLESIFTSVIALCNTFGAPLLALFLLGMLTRRTTAAGALAALVLGTLLTLAVTFDVAGGFAPRKTPHPIWSVTIGTLGTMAIGYVLSFVFGRRKSREELTGLVAGVGTLGVRAEKVEVATDMGDGRWA